MAVELYDYDHVYTVAPDLWFNKDKTVQVRMKVAPQDDIEKYKRIAAVLEVEAREKKMQELIASKVLGIDGLTVGGHPVTSWEELKKRGPNELLQWITVACFSTQMLCEAEIKN
jgi:hypothetical protein